MKVLMLNTFDATGGAARTASRLLSGVRSRGVHADMLVQFKSGHSDDILCSPNPLRKLARRLKVFVGTLPVRLYPKNPENNFSPALLPERVPGEIADIDPDIIHLHWICAGFLRVETLRTFNRPIIWTLHDSWAFTGGCHVPFDCTRYRENCGVCPVLGSASEKDLSRWTWNRKAKAWRDLDLTVVTPSRWLADCARSSSLFRDVRVEVIPNGLETETFQPLDKVSSRNSLGLPQGEKIILFGAVRGMSDPNKGFHLLTGALKEVARESNGSLAVVFGSSAPAGMPDLGMPVRFLGRIDDDHSLARIYSAADVFVAPSMQENLPNTVMEAMACGTPCVAFRQGGVPDLVDHEVSGYLAQPFDTGDLARGIEWVLGDDDRRARLSVEARRKITAEFSLAEVSERYVNIYRELLGKS
ncbi:glycosyltransferase family 4 protein [Desulfuromonas sp. TF]|uniref:glycosyltransferase family 4 protein n=1 Tax=Desulfuromonas sp. TF TaxID=1232410 RepID=UPI000486EA10|nr:glycosyltransferase family 4 protein [Desulfuromonas sp. TF]